MYPLENVSLAYCTVSEGKSCIAVCPHNVRHMVSFTLKSVVTVTIYTEPDV